MGLALKKEHHPEEAQKLIEAIDRYYANLANVKLDPIPVPIALILVDRIPDIDLHLKDAHSDNIKCFRQKGLYMSQVEIDTLAENGTTLIYISRNDARAFTQFVEVLLTELPASTTMADEKKVTMLRQSAISVMNEIFTSPTPENIDKGVKTVTGFVHTLMKDPKAYGMLLKLSSHDPYTLQHSVGVATNSIILASKSGITDEKTLIEVGIGGLLHDIGKTKVKPEIINKQGPLDDAEWQEMKQHAMFGYEILKDNPNIGMRAKLAILQHHEEPAGTGYPLGLQSEQIDQFAKIVALSDIYNAITTDRSYSKAKPPFEAFQLIKQKLSHKVDHVLFELLVKIYGNKT